MKVEVEWKAWMSVRNGNDGRRPSGVSYNHTKYQHAIPKDGTFRSLCGKPVGISCKQEELPRCPICLKRA